MLFPRENVFRWKRKLIEYRGTGSGRAASGSERSARKSYLCARGVNELIKNTKMNHGPGETRH